MKNFTLILLLVAAFGLQACKKKFVPVYYGHESCTHCKMTIMDKHFAAEILTGKGKAYKFDDFGCLLKYIKEEKFNDPDAKYFVADYNDPEGKFLDARHAIYLHSETLHSPMNGNFAASSSNEDADKLNVAFNTRLFTWENLKQ